VHSDQVFYPLPSRRTSKERRIEQVWVPSPENHSEITGLGEGKWERREVEVEVPAELKRLFTFAH